MACLAAAGARTATMSVVFSTVPLVSSAVSLGTAIQSAMARALLSCRPLHMVAVASAGETAAITIHTIPTRTGACMSLSNLKRAGPARSRLQCRRRQRNASLRSSRWFRLDVCCHVGILKWINQPWYYSLWYSLSPWHNGLLRNHKSKYKVGLIGPGRPLLGV